MQCEILNVMKKVAATIGTCIEFLKFWVLSRVGQSYWMLIDLGGGHFFLIKRAWLLMLIGYKLRGNEALLHDLENDKQIIASVLG